MLFVARKKLDYKRLLKNLKFEKEELHAQVKRPQNVKLLEFFIVTIVDTFKLNLLPEEVNDSLVLDRIYLATGGFDWEIN